MKKKTKYFVILTLFLLLVTGCTTNLKDKEGNVVKNDVTGQTLTENILCRPNDEESIKLYKENGMEEKLNELPFCTCKEDYYTESVYTNGEYVETKMECTQFTAGSNGYDGLWASIFVKPLAWVILFFGRFLNNYCFGLIITTLLIRLIAFPLTKKTALQSENMKKAQPELDRLEKKYSNSDPGDRDALMKKSQEMMAIYKKYDISPLSGCLFSLIQLPLFFAFLEAINRTPIIFEEYLFKGSFFEIQLGTTPYVGVTTGHYFYIFLVILVGVTTFFSFRASSNSAGNSDTAKQTQMMMNMFLVMIIVTSVFMTSALCIYWVVSNAFTLGQNYLVKRSKKTK